MLLKSVWLGFHVTCSCDGIVTTLERCYTWVMVYGRLQRGWLRRFHNSFNFNVLGNGVTVARLTLDQLVKVQILVPQFDLRRFKKMLCRAGAAKGRIPIARVDTCF